MAARPNAVTGTRVSRAALPDFTDLSAAADEWSLLAPAIAGRSAMRTLVRRKDRVTYPESAQRPLSTSLPTVPSAVLLWDATGRLPVLALDFDAKNGHGPRTAETDACAAMELLTGVGLRPVADRGPTGGWHVYARLPQPAAEWQVRQAAAALGALWPSLDPGPLLNPMHGCIRPPGSIHKTGGHQRLVEPLDEAVAAFATPPPADAWQRLWDRIRADEFTAQPAAAPDAVASPAVGARHRRIAAPADVLARTGSHPTRTFKSPSEARFSVVCHAVNAGWGLADIEHAMRGEWQWLRCSYGAKHHTALARDFTKAKKRRSQDRVSRPVRISDTSRPNSQRGDPTLLAEPDIHLALRRFTAYAREHSRRSDYSPTLRAVLNSVIWAGHVQGRLLINVGVRSLAEQAAVHFDTVAEMLHELAEDGLITRVTQARGTDADVWRINAELGANLAPAPGRRVGLRPVFRTLGGHLVGEVYETLCEARHPLATSELVRRLGYDRRRVHEALVLLAGWDLAQSTPQGWSRGAADPVALARRLGGYEHWKAQHELHVSQRADWAARLEHLRTKPVEQPPGQLDWHAEFAAVFPDDQAWIESLASGSPPSDMDDAVTLVQRALGGTTVA